jgi:hypothetical protein
VTIEDDKANSLSCHVGELDAQFVFINSYGAIVIKSVHRCVMIVYLADLEGLCLTTHASQTQAIAPACSVPLTGLVCVCSEKCLLYSSTRGDREGNCSATVDACVSSKAILIIWMRVHVKL